MGIGIRAGRRPWAPTAIWAGLGETPVTLSPKEKLPCLSVAWAVIGRGSRHVTSLSPQVQSVTLGLAVVALLSPASLGAGP